MEQKAKTPLENVHTEFKNKVEDIGEMPIIKMMNLRRNFNRINPTILFFFLSVIGIILGIAFVSLRILLWIGGFVVALFVVFFVLAYYFDKIEKFFFKLIGMA